MSKQHTCVAEVNAMLKEQNTALLGVITLGPGPERIALATVKADDQVRKKPVLFFASYCPMCGVKLDTLDHSTAAKEPTNDR